MGKLNMTCIEFEHAANPDIEYTVNLIKHLHAGQTDQSGKPYVNHPLRVASNVRRIAPNCNDDIVMAALLHDTIEDCDIDKTELRQKNYSEECIAIVSLVTKTPDDNRSYAEVIDGLIASGNQGAMKVKIADNMDNLHPRRVSELKQINPEKAERLGNRYRDSIEKLSMATGINKDRVFEIINKAAPLESYDAALK